MRRTLRNGLSITKPLKKETINLNNQILKGWEKFDRDHSIETFLSHMKYNTAGLTDVDNNDGSDSENEIGEEEAVPAAPENEANVDPEAERYPVCLMDNPEEKWAFVPC